ncbi:uncharacterized protein LOC121727185 isoform X1 [Aricia agestis]|uniref:uncharacterized protein LOC121727185 isoform X1 n=1 Tax=Aricia agestis TaxID=91739 RepID=UPI001C205B0B|nr:uncharacterized protein LOC121727185 isoform X1 [Aricia agestis]
MYIKTSKVLLFMMVIQVLNGTVNVLGDFGVKTLLSTAPNHTGLLRSLEKLKYYKIIIPEECKTKKFCENIPNYPEETMTEIIERLAAYFVVNKHSARLAVHENSTGASLCHSQKWFHVPLAIADEAGKWVLVVNSKVNPVQTYEGESCRNDQKSLCKSLKFQPRYHGQCTEMYVRRKVLVINEEMNLLVEKSQPLPCCCMCGEVREHF